MPGQRSQRYAGNHKITNSSSVQAAGNLHASFVSIITWKIITCKRPRLFGFGSQAPQIVILSLRYNRAQQPFLNLNPTCRQLHGHILSTNSQQFVIHTTAMGISNNFLGASFYQEPFLKTMRCVINAASIFPNLPLIPSHQND